MKAVIYEKYGAPEVLKLVETDKPSIGEKDVLVRIKTSTVTSGAIWARQGRHPDSAFFSAVLRLIFGVWKPRKKILGYEFSGTVVATGGKVSLYKEGDEVFGTTTGLKAGAYAEYAVVPEKWRQGVMALKPDSLSHEEAAALPVGAMTALEILRKGRISQGDSVLIYGASGSVGTYAVQLALDFGASVTAVCGPSSREVVESLGSVDVIDYTKEDFASKTESFDVIFDAVGKISRSRCGDSLKKEGRFLTVKSPTSETDEKLQCLIDLAEKGKLKPYIDKSYSLEETAEAHRYADTGHKKGNVVIRVS